MNNLFDSFDKVVKYGYESLMKVDGIKNLSSDSISKIKTHIRKTAIENTRKRIEKRGKTVADYSKDKIDHLVASEEERIINQFKSNGLKASLVIIGLGSLLGDDGEVLAGEDIDADMDLDDLEAEIDENLLDNKDITNL
tara:strand:+ start:622 stop:1038 length:417 start_codon:yes stop_codon:yes gene_type:complete